MRICISVTSKCDSTLYYVVHIPFAHFAVAFATIAFVSGHCEMNLSGLNAWEMRTVEDEMWHSRDVWLIRNLCQRSTPTLLEMSLQVYPIIMWEFVAATHTHTNSREKLLNVSSVSTYGSGLRPTIIFQMCQTFAVNLCYRRNNVPSRTDSAVGGVLIKSE